MTPEEFAILKAKPWDVPQGGPMLRPGLPSRMPPSPAPAISVPGSISDDPMAQAGNLAAGRPDPNVSQPNDFARGVEALLKLLGLRQ